MIAYIQGTVLKKTAKNAIIDTGNIGYLIHLPQHIAQKIQEKEEVAFFIYTKVREDEIALYGFETYEELEFFKIVLGVNGIGPKIALEILSSDLNRTKAAIVGNDLLFLTKIPGIGKKTAERMVVELKNKLDFVDTISSHQKITNQINEESIAALLGLGYQKFEITRILKTLPENIINTEEIITYFLRNV